MTEDQIIKEICYSGWSFQMDPTCLYLTYEDASALWQTVGIWPWDDRPDAGISHDQLLEKLSNRKVQ
jgi:hypothetical protein